MIKNKLIPLLLFLIFLTSSFDIFLNLNIFGFNLRVIYIFILILDLICLFEIIVKRKILLPIGFLWLGIWTLFIFIFVFNTSFLLRSIGYALWLIMNISLIFSLVNIGEQYEIEKYLRLYLYSFGVMALFGIIQFFTPVIGLPPVFVTDWWIKFTVPRVNGLTYEPSYFATYLTLGFGFHFILFIRKEYIGMKKWLFHTILIAELISLVYCSSRMGWGMLIFLMLFGIIYLTVSSIRINRLDLPLVKGMGLLLIIGGISVGSLFYLSNGTQNLLRDTGITVESKGSLQIRLTAMLNTWEVFKKNPIIGVSLGGVATHIAQMKGVPVESNRDLKPYEGNNVFLEVLAASGVIGGVFFVLYIGTLLIMPFGMKKYIFKVYEFALLTGFILGLGILFWNQNILRPYLWVHIGLISLVNHRYRSKAV